MDGQAGIGFSPLYQEVHDVKNNYKGLIQKTMKAAGIAEGDIDLVIMSGDSGSGIREYEEAAVIDIFGEDQERRFIKDHLGENLGASAASAVVVSSVLIKNERYEKILVLGTEVSGTIEAYVVSKKKG